jgi:hypothetical protein
MWPHIEQIYDTVYKGDITEIYSTLPAYDIVLMADVIEHIEKQGALRVVEDFLARGAAVIVASPVRFFSQAAFDSEWEQHRSHWRPRDFAFAPWMEWETFGSGRIYLLANAPERLKFFGSRPYRRVRRLVKGFYDASR